MKVIARIDTAMYENPSDSADSAPVKTFQFFYALQIEDGSSEKTKNGFYRIADGQNFEDEVGWIKETDVVEWPHRQALGLRPSDSREGLACFFESRDDVEQRYQGKRIEEMSREPEGATGFTLLPMLKTFSMEADGDKVSGYQIAYMHSRGTGGHAR